MAKWLWAGAASRSVLMHRSASGKWSTATIAGAGTRNPRVFDLARIPGTTSLWGVGALQLRNDSWNANGAILRFNG